MKRDFEALEEAQKMGPLIVLFEAGIVFFGCWTISYHVVLFTALPAIINPLLFVPLTLLFTAIFFRKWTHLWPLRDNSLILNIAAISAITGCFALVNFRPDADDIEFFHRAFVQNFASYQPYATTDTIHNLNNLPALTILHVATSYEPLMAFLAKILHIEPVWFYQNIGALVAAILLPPVYALLYAEFGVKKRTIPLCIIVSILFLLLDGNMHRSFGNVSLVRFWQGKTILWSLVIPTATLFFHRFLVAPKARRFMILCFLCASAMGLSNSAVFLLPVLSAAISVAFLLCHGLNKRLIFTGILSCLPTLYCLGFGIVLKIGLLPVPNLAVFQWPQTTWLANLWLVMGSITTLIRNLFVLVVVPLINLRSPHKFFFLAFGATLCLIFANPLTGPLWIEALTPANYWRFMYLFPLPWCAGLAAKAMIPMGQFRLNRTTWVFPVLLLLFILAFKAPAAQLNNLKYPSDYNFSRRVTRFCLLAKDLLNNRQVLASPEIAEVLPLFNPTLRMESHRPNSTIHILRNAGLLSEGERRSKAQAVVGSGYKSDESIHAFQESIEKGIDAIVTQEQYLPLVLQELGTQKKNWSVALVSSGYNLLLKNTEYPQ